MSKVVVTKTKLDSLAVSVSTKSGESLPLTLDEMKTAVDSIVGGNPNLETVTKSYTPTESQQTETIEPSSGYDGIEEVNVTVGAISSSYVGSGVTRRSSSDLADSGATVTAPAGYYGSSASKTVASGTEGTPTATKGTVSNHSVSVTPSVTNSAGYISGGTHTGTAVSVSASELVSGTLSVTSSGTKDVTNYASASIPAGTAGTPIATKGTVSNHSVSVTPSVTNQTGFITGSTKTGTAVTVSASELDSGAKSITANGNSQDVVGYATVNVSVPNSYSASDEGKVVSSGALVSQTSATYTENNTYDTTTINSVTVNVSGGSSGIAVATATKTLTAAASSIQFTNLSGNPTSFVVTSSADQATGGTKVVAVAYDGTSCHGMDVTTQAEADTGFTKTYSNGTLTITATTATFEANEYKLVYTYGGSSSDIHTSDVQVGSGATSITFSGLSGRPVYFSCVFKSDFSTSSGYQRVIEVVNDGTNTYGHAMDSSAKAQTSWSYSYSGGSLTITSTGTNNGGYFHQPGYYQLTYAVDSNAPSYQAKTGIGATTSSQTITADNGYDALESVQINAVSQTNLVAGNIKNGTTINISNGNTNLWSVTGTYEGGGGSSKNVQVLQSTTRVNASSLTKALGDMTVSKTGTYDIYWSGGRSNTSTSYTWGTRLYVDGSGYGTENTSWSNNCQSNYLSNVSLTANQKLSVYARGRTGSYYTFVPMLVIIES